MKVHYTVLQHLDKSWRRSWNGSCNNCLGMAGYNGALAVQSESALTAISNLYIYAPIIFLVILPILYCFYKLDKQYPQVIKELTERENKNK